MDFLILCDTSCAKQGLFVKVARLRLYETQGLTEVQWRKGALLPPPKPEAIARPGTTGILDGLGRYRGGMCLMADHVDRTVEDVTPMKKGTRER